MQAAQIDQTIIDVAQDHGLKPGLLEYHVRELHGWNPGEVGYADAVSDTVQCRRDECLLLISELEATRAREHVTDGTDCWCEPTVAHVPAPASV